MSALQSIVLGIVQGLTEFLPISSTGHLRIVPAFLGWEDPGTAYTAVIQLGTMAAVLLYFRAELWRIAAAWLAGLRDPSRRAERDSRMGWYLIVGTIPISILGVALKDTIETDTRDLALIGSALIAFGLVMLVIDRAARCERSDETIGLRDALAVGGAQSLALIPGVSRSGATISAGLMLGLDRASAARFSFLLSVPAVVLSGLYELKDAVGDSTGASTLSLAVGIATAFVSGYASIAFLLRYLATHTLAAFVAYRVGLGAIVVALVAANVIS